MNFLPVLVDTVKDESSVKSTDTNPIFIEFFQTLLVIQILRYFISRQIDIQTAITRNFRYLNLFLVFFPRV